MLITTTEALYELDLSDDAPQPQRLRDQPPAAESEGGLYRVLVGPRGAVTAIPTVSPRPSHEASGPIVVDADLGEPVACVLLLTEEHGLEALIGTEGAHLYRLKEGSIGRVEGFDELTVRSQWHTPWGGPPAVRSMAMSPDGTIYADIHVGSIIRSGDHGKNWEPVTPDLHQDVHQVATSAANAMRVYANTANGPWVSDDHGLTWAHRAEPLGNRYGRAVAVDPDDPDLMLATVSDGPHGDNVHGQLYRSEDAGRSWEQVADPFPESTPENINTHRLLFARPTRTEPALALVANDTKLYAATDRAAAWRVLCELPEPIERIG
ncbi:MAG: WD40/YVTN/BNR-like repeat-containing protein [Phycisphaerae bacterium]